MAGKTLSESEIQEARREAANHPATWFCVLMQARDRGDHETAALATRELELMGVRVRFSRRKAVADGR